MYRLYLPGLVKLRALTIPTSPSTCTATWSIPSVGSGLPSRSAMYRSWSHTSPVVPSRYEKDGERMGRSISQEPFRNASMNCSLRSVSTLVSSMVSEPLAGASPSMSRDLILGDGSGPGTTATASHARTGRMLSRTRRQQGQSTAVAGLLATEALRTRTSGSWSVVRCRPGPLLAQPFGDGPPEWDVEVGSVGPHPGADLDIGAGS